MSAAGGNDRAALAHPSARALRWNALLTAALLGVITVLGASLAERHLTRRIDLSEDGLYAVAPATRRIVDRIEDRVVVRLFATEEVADGQYALRTARVRAQLDELIALSPESFELQVLDPSVSSEARKRAADARFRPRQGRGGGLGGGASEEVWLSLELGYRGRTARIPEPMPWQFETQFASRLHGLLSDRRIGVGWFGSPLDPPPEAGDDPQSRIAAT
ncbi:MAG: Gldg family protein, partial [Planctomycetota bacterium]|nr:Gldg family protein [Planctomycetota bacterium]